MMKRFLFNLFKEDFMKFAFSEQGKPPDFSELDTKFLDSKGRRYYAYKDDFDIPILRKGKIEQLIIELNAGISGNELDMFFKEMEKALDKGQADVSKIGFLITEMKDRKTLLLHPEILFEMVSVLYIREDEDPAVIDEEIHAEKIEQFNSDIKGGLYDFFYSAGINTFVPYLTKLKTDWDKYLEKDVAKIKAMESFISAGGLSSTPTKPVKKSSTSPKVNRAKYKKSEDTVSKTT